MQPGRTLYFPVQLIISLGEICPKLTSVSPCVDIIIKHIEFSDLIEQIELFLFFCVVAPLLPEDVGCKQQGRECENIFEIVSDPPARCFPAENFKNFPGCMLNLESHTRCVGCVYVWLCDRRQNNQHFYKAAGMFCLVRWSASLHKQNAQAVCATDGGNKPPRAGVLPLRSPYGRWRPAATPSEVFSAQPNNCGQIPKGKAAAAAVSEQKEKSALGRAARRLFAELASKAIAAK